MKEDAETTVPAITRGIVHNVTTALARQAFNIEDDEVAQYQAVALTARDHLVRSEFHSSPHDGSLDADEPMRATPASDPQLE